jgi:hypothetical protein
MDWLKSKGKMWNGRWIPRKKMDPRKRASRKRAPIEAMILAHMNVETGRGVCEMCAASWPLNELTTEWIGQGNEEEGILLCTLCRDCKAEGGE